MPNLIPDSASLNVLIDSLYSPTGRVGALVLLNEPPPPTLAVIVNTQANELATTSPHGLTTGSRVRLASSGALPGGTSSNIDYVAMTTSATTFKLATLAAPTTPLVFNSAGSGQVTAVERLIDETDRIEVLLAKELRTSSYVRYPIVDLGSAVAGKKPTKPIRIENKSTVPITYTHHLILLGGSTTVGDATGVTGVFLYKEAVPCVLAPAATRTILLDLELL